MKVLFKSLEEISLEYPVKEDDGFLFINDRYISKGAIKFFGKEAEAEYNEQDDSYIVGDYAFHPSFIKGEVIGYTIKRLSDGKKCTFSI